MISVAAFLATLTVVQGQALQLDYPHEAGLQGIEVMWADRRIPFARADDGWFTLIGIDVDKDPGDYPTQVSFSYAEPGVSRRPSRCSASAFPPRS